MKTLILHFCRVDNATLQWLFDNVIRGSTTVFDIRNYHVLHNNSLGDWVENISCVYSEEQKRRRLQFLILEKNQKQNYCADNAPISSMMIEKRTPQCFRISDRYMGFDILMQLVDEGDNTLDSTDHCDGIPNFRMNVFTTTQHSDGSLESLKHQIYQVFGGICLKGIDFADLS